MTPPGSVPGVLGRTASSLVADLVRTRAESLPGRRLRAATFRVLRYAAALALYATGLTGRLLRRRLLRSRAAIVLGYHGVEEGPSGALARGHGVDLLAAQLRFYRRWLRPVRLEEIAEPVGEGGDPPAGSFAVTFDDGLVNHVRMAAPLLRSLGIPATFFVPSGLVGSESDLWVARLREIVLRWGGGPLPEQPGLWPAMPAGTPTERLAAYVRIKETLKRRPDRLAESLAGLAAIAGGSPRPPEMHRVSDWDGIASLAREGFGIGAHSRTHPILATLSHERAREEIDGSRRDLEAALSAPVRDFAYPNGRFEDFDDAICRIVGQAGYRCAVTTEPGIVRRGDDRLALRRCLPENVPPFLAGFDLLVRAWKDRGREGDAARPIPKRVSCLRREGGRAAA
jgi:peptidoglycan/xylan/chitin deacetylase (PgdA/CDA1 family)